MSTYFICEKGVSGILACLFYSFTNKVMPDYVFSGDFQQEIGASVIKITAKEEEKQRVKNALLKYSQHDLFFNIDIALRYHGVNAYKTVFDYCYKVLRTRNDIYTHIADPIVSAFLFSIQTVLFEKHRISGFLRFTETENGIMYSTFTPDNDILEIVAPHFLKRLGKIPFVIHDVKRNEIAMSDGKSLKFIFTPKRATITVSENQRELENLWKKYFKTVAIKERKNTRQQNQFMPKKYRKNMLENFSKD